MVLGETQILGQVKEAYGLSREQDSVGKILHALFNHAAVVGKRAHAETAIGQNAVSVSYAAVELARKVFSSLEGRKVLVIGAGETAELTVKNLVSVGVRTVVVANRTLQRAEDLAGQYGGIPISIEDIGLWLPEVDVVISSTEAPHLVLRRETVQEAMRMRRGRPMFLFDIAVPRDIDPNAGRLDNIFLYDIDDLQSVVEANLRERVRESKKVEWIIEEEHKKLNTWLRTLEVVPIIRSLREKVEQVRRTELEKAMAKLPDLTEKERAVIEAMTVVMMNKILNDPTVRIKEFAAEANGSVYLETVSQLFNLNPSKSEEQPKAAVGTG
jgi:glutamyl-tRNA reductase